jgi:hypothetical protein
MPGTAESGSTEATRTRRTSGSAATARAASGSVSEPSRHRAVFTPVRTKADDGTKCVVYSDIYVDEGGNYVETIGTYDEIIAEPSE